MQIIVFVCRNLSQIKTVANTKLTQKENSLKRNLIRKIMSSGGFTFGPVVKYEVSVTASSPAEGEVSQESLMMNSLVSSLKYEFGGEKWVVCVCVGLNRISCEEVSSDT